MNSAAPCAMRVTHRRQGASRTDNVWHTPAGTTIDLPSHYPNVNSESGVIPSEVEESRAFSPDGDPSTSSG